LATTTPAELHRGEIPKEIHMNVFGAMIAAEHLLDLQREADAFRLANAAAQVDEAGRRSAVQRLAGKAARRLSRGLAALAARVDPREDRRMDERRRRPAAA
jgi:hypothetical protein